MSWFRDHPRAALLIGLTLALPLLLVLMLLLNLLAMRSNYQGEIDRLEPRVARLMGLREQAELLAAQAGRVDAQVLALVYPQAEDRASVATSLQKGVRDIFTEAGMNISSSQILSSSTENGLEHLPVKVTATGSLTALDLALSALHGYRPLLMVEAMDIHPSRRGASRNREPQQITVSLQILALRQAE
ncbi:MAG: type II secretion system protein GspM [Parahaliea sp.]